MSDVFIYFETVDKFIKKIQDHCKQYIDCVNCDYFGLQACSAQYLKDLIINYYLHPQLYLQMCGRVERKRLTPYQQERALREMKEFFNQPKKPKSWRFAMPSSEIAKVKCKDKLFHLGFCNPIYGFYYNDGKGIGGFDGFDYYFGCLKEYEELTLSKFLALPEPQPKKPLPEWVKKDCLVMFWNDGWNISILEKIDITTAYPFKNFREGCFTIIAPLDYDFFKSCKQHPEQITADDLSSYDVEAWRENA